MKRDERHLGGPETGGKNDNFWLSHGGEEGGGRRQREGRGQKDRQRKGQTEADRHTAVGRGRYCKRERCSTRETEREWETDRQTDRD